MSYVAAYVCAAVGFGIAATIGFIPIWDAVAMALGAALALGIHALIRRGWE